MLINASFIVGSKLHAEDGEIGVVKDLYFDDTSWEIRYLVVDTGGWLSGRKVLLTPEAILNYEATNRVLKTALSRQQVKDSPDRDEHQPVSRQQELKLHTYYGWTPYWSGQRDILWPSPFSYPVTAIGPTGYVTGVTPNLTHDIGDARIAREVAARGEAGGDPHLRSFSEIKKYGLRAADGDIGHVDDMFVEPGTWRLTHFIADAKKWWPGGQVLIDVAMVDDVVWEDDKIVVAMTKQQVRGAPPYEADTPMTEEYLKHLSSYYWEISSDTSRRPAAEDRPLLS